MTDDLPNIVLCWPVSLRPVPSEIAERCSCCSCGAEVWLGLSTIELLKRTTQPHVLACMPCATGGPVSADAILDLLARNTLLTTREQTELTRQSSGASLPDLVKARGGVVVELKTEDELARSAS